MREGSGGGSNRAARCPGVRMVFPAMCDSRFHVSLIHIETHLSSIDKMTDYVTLSHAVAGCWQPRSINGRICDMLIGYARVSKTDGSQVHDLQRDALVAAGVEPDKIYADSASGRRDDRPGLDACLKALRTGDTLAIWKLDRLGRDLRHLVNTVAELTAREIGLKVLAGEGASIDTTTANGRLIFGIFAALAEFERELKIGRAHV